MTRSTLFAGTLTLGFLLACGGGTTVNGDGGSFTGGGAVAESITALPNPGTGEWDRGVTAIMIASYDSNGSGSVDTESEIGAIPCDVYKALDSAVYDKSEYSGSHYHVIYGVAPDFIWVGANGIDESMRSAMWSAMQGCGFSE